MHKIERKITIIVTVILLAAIIGLGVACNAGQPESNVVKRTYLTVKEPGANMHTTSDVKSQKNVLKSGAIFPGIEVKVLDTEIVAYKVITKGTPEKPSRTGWIYAGLVKSITNK